MGGVGWGGSGGEVPGDECGWWNWWRGEGRPKQARGEEMGGRSEALCDLQSHLEAAVNEPTLDEAHSANRDESTSLIGRCI